MKPGVEPLLMPLFRSFAANLVYPKNGSARGDGDMFVQLSRDEEIADFVGSVIGDEDAIFKRRFISMLSKLNESQWELLEQMVNKLKED